MQGDFDLRRCLATSRGLRDRQEGDGWRAGDRFWRERRAALNDDQQQCPGAHELAA
jgi:hypothetical protein